MGEQGSDNCPCADQLWVRYQADRSIPNRNALVEFYLPLCRIVAGTRRRAGDIAGIDDLIADGSFGLIYAVEHFPTDHYGTFERYAWNKIRCAMIDAFRRQTHAARKGEIRPVVMFCDPADLESIYAADQNGHAEFWEHAMIGLADRERQIVLSYCRGWTFAEIGRQLNRSEARIHQLYKAALRRVRENCS